jgi:hypothetical protein
MKDDRVYLDQILESLTWISSFTQEGRDVFFHDRKTQSAVLRELQTLAAMSSFTITWASTSNGSGTSSPKIFRPCAP